MNAHRSANSAERYRIKAAEMSAKAAQETKPALKAEYGRLAAAYRRLATQAERNSATDVFYEPPMRPQNPRRGPRGSDE
jgi:hypothetical protein